MNDLKDYTITVSEKADKLIEYSGGSFVVVKIKSTEGKTFDVPKTKKDGSTTKAYAQVQKVSVGDSITVAVDEKEITNDKGTFTRRTIRAIKADEHGVPHTSQQIDATQGAGWKKQAEDNYASLEARVSKLEKLHRSDVEEMPEDTNLDQMPF